MFRIYRLYQKELPTSDKIVPPLGLSSHFSYIVYVNKIYRNGRLVTRRFVGTLLADKYVLTAVSYGVDLMVSNQISYYFTITFFTTLRGAYNFFFTPTPIPTTSLRPIEAQPIEGQTMGSQPR